MRGFGYIFQRWRPLDLIRKQKASTKQEIKRKFLFLVNYEK